MVIDSLNAYLDLALAIGAVVVLVGGLFRWLNRSLEKRIVAEIKQATYQIQPNANGGRSLSDLHKKFDGLTQDVDLIKAAVIQLEDDVDQLEQDVEELK
jgi:uncharacterized protein YoxC